MTSRSLNLVAHNSSGRLETVIIDRLFEIEKAARNARRVEMKKLHRKWKETLKARNAVTLPMTDAMHAELSYLETQMTLIKEVDLDVISRSAVHRKVLKDPYLSHDADFMKVFNAKVPQKSEKVSRSKEEQDLEAQLLSIRALSSAIKTSIASFRNSLQKWGSISSNEEMSLENPIDVWDGLESLPQDDMEDNSSCPGYSDNELDDDGWESGSVDITGQVASQSSQRNHPIVEGFSDSDSGLASSDLDSSKNEEPQPKSDQEALKQNPKESMFLPSLAAAYVPGDADPNDDWENIDIDGPVRRNRRGQRARRAIAERTYGLKANHLKSKREALEERAKKRADRLAKLKASGRVIPRRQEVNSDKRSHTVKDDGFFDSGTATVLGTEGLTSVLEEESRVRKGIRIGSISRSIRHSGDLASREVAPEKPVHPSWEAKMRLKQKQALTFARPKGKKIVFD